ncbi:MAG TPA: vitamin K epoxide reductase family protein, partial [Solirubrobacteraceae bacterium]|nr:vitamin K epoxide reductase family protein [Solirubrobacteraceae bacterium]
ARSATALLAFAGAGFSGWLSYVEIARLDAICAWCVASALCMAVLAGLAAARVLSAPDAPPAAPRARPRPRARRA